MPVSDYATATAWYERFLGSAPSLLPNDIEAVWEVGEHQYVYILVRPADAGHGLLTLFVDDLDDLDDRMSAIASRGLEPTQRETYDNGVRKVTFHDPDGNEIGFGGRPAS